MEFKKQIVYYTDSRLEEKLDEAVRKQILKASGGIPIISVSQKPLDFGNNICVGIKPRCYLSLYEQLLTGLEAADDNTVIYLCEHDVFYHPSHFNFIPPRVDKIYYNLNRYYWMRNINYFMKSIGKRALSQGVAWKSAWMPHVREQVQVRKDGIASPCIGQFLNFESKFPNVDIRHNGNFSNSNRFKNRDKDKLIRNTMGEQAETYIIEGWGTPRMFQREVGYKNIDITTYVHLHRIFNSDNNENPVEVKKFVRAYLPGLFHSLGFKKGAEIGVKLGVFSKQICELMPNGVHLKCIDPYLPGPTCPWDEAEKRFVVAKHTLKHFDTQLIKKTSLHAADEDVPRGSLDFVYIDADHSFDNVMQDIIVWAERVRIGGIVSGHDYDNEDVKTAVDAYVNVHGHELFITEKGERYPDSSPSWFFAKT